MLGDGTPNGYPSPLLGNNLGNKLSETQEHSSVATTANTGSINRATPHLSGWGPGGRRFKSCLPD